MHLDEYRKEKKLSQKQFGLLLAPPASPSLVSQWECAITRITLDYSLEIFRVTDGLVTGADCSAMFAKPKVEVRAEADA